MAYENLPESYSLVVKSLDLMWLVHLEFFFGESDELEINQEKRRQPSGDDCRVELFYSLN